MHGTIDTSVFCGHFPLRKLSRSSPQQVRELLAANGVTQAWVTPVEAMFYPEPMQANEPLMEAARRDDFFVPVGVVNVIMATWRRDARACLDGGCGLLKVFPSWHDFELGDKRVDELADLAADAGVPLAIQVQMLDQRANFHLMKVAPIPAEPIVQLARRHPETRLLSCASSAGHLRAYRDVPNLWSDISFVETPNTLASAVEAMGSERLTFGSHAPIFYLLAGLAKLDPDPADVPAQVVEAVRGANALALLGR